jgi:hypothetical protein
VSSQTYFYCANDESDNQFQIKEGARASGLIDQRITMMESTIVQNGAPYFAQHRHTKRDHHRLRQTVADKVGRKFMIIGSRVAEGLELWSSYRPVTSK